MRDYLDFLLTNRRFLAFGALLAGLSSLGQTFLLALFGGVWRETFDLSHTAFGLIYSGATLLSALALISLGRQLDVMDLRRFTTMVLLGAAAGALLLAASQTLWMLALAFLLLRLCGQGLMVHTAQASMARYFSANRGKAIGLAMLGLPLAEALMPMLVVGTAAAIGWRGAWGLLAALVVVFVLPLVWWLLRDHATGRKIGEAAPSPGPTSAVTAPSWSRAEVLRDRRFYGLLPAAMGPGFMVTALFFHQTVIADARDWSLAWLASSFTAFAAGHVLGLLLGGPLVDRLRATRLVSVFLLPMILGVLLLALFTGPWLAPVYLVLCGLSVGAAGPVMGALWAELYGVNHLGAIRAMAQAVAVFMTAVAPALAGLLLDLGFTVSALAAALVVYGLLASGVARLVMRRV